jgi:hypothetical protein
MISMAAVVVTGQVFLGQFLCQGSREGGRDGKVWFSPVLQGLFKNPELDHWFGSWIMANLKPDHQFGSKRSGSGSPAL